MGEALAGLEDPEEELFESVADAVTHIVENFSHEVFQHPDTGRLYFRYRTYENKVRIGASV